MSTRIAQCLRQLAAAQRVSQESTDETVQGQSGKLSEEELAKVAAKGAESVEDDTSAWKKAGADGAAAAAAAATPGTDDTAVDSGTPAADDAAAAPTDVPPDGPVPDGTGAEDPAADAAEVDAIKTPTETELTAAKEKVAEGETTSTDDTGTSDTTEMPADDSAAPENAEASTDAPADGTDATDTTSDDTTEVATDTGETTDGTDPASDATDATDDTGVNLDAGADPDNALPGEAGDISAHDDAGADSSAAPGDTGVASDMPSDSVSTDVTVDSPATNDTPADNSADAGGDPTATPAMPTGDDVATDVQAEEPQKPAPAPGPQTDASQTVQEVVQLTEALAQAQSAEEVVREAQSTSDDLTGISETAKFSNEQGGVTVESFAGLTHAIHPYASRLGRRIIDFGVTFEAYRGRPLTHREMVGLEDVDSMIDEIEMAQPQLERQRIESLDRVTVALKSALPTASKRLKAVLSKASNSSDHHEGSTVDVSDGLAAALSIDGVLPTDICDELQNYAQLGKMLLGPFSESAMRAAKSAGLLNNVVNFSSTAVFWEKMGEALDKIVDPRTTLTRTQLESGLPGGTRLFDQAVPPLDATNPVLQKFFDFNGSYAPLATAMATKNVTGTTAPALSPSKIVLVGNALLDILNEERICCRLDEGQKLWPEAQDALRHLEENLDNAPTTIETEAGNDFSQIVKYVEINYSLATWPLLNYLTNLVLTINAFVLFAERSLVAKVGDGVSPEVQLPNSKLPADDAAAMTNDTDTDTEETSVPEKKDPMDNLDNLKSSPDEKENK